MDSAELLDIAREAADAAAPLLLDRFGFERPLRTKSSPTDLVSEADVLAEQAIREVLLDRVPDDAIVGEEGVDVAGSSGRRWLIDPIDGTTNYVYGNPQWCISIACEGLAGVVLDPVRGELFAAHAAGPATINGVAIAPRESAPLSAALVATGFGYEDRIRHLQGERIARLLPLVRDIRRAGSAALDLAWTAAGRLDAYFEHGVKAWDIAAGAVICERAGLLVQPLERAGGLESGLLAAPHQLAAELLPLVGPSWT